MPHNIERHPTKPGAYLGYVQGGVWLVFKRDHMWHATEILAPAYECAKTLRELARKIEGI